jgi:nucleoid-associated protein YgaU
MALEKATITPDGGDAIKVLFNPTEYTLDQSNQVAESPIPGLRAPILQYIHGNVRTLSMDLYFDTYEQQTDVRDETNKIYGLLGIAASTHVPPICSFEWGSLKFRCVLERVGGRFTLFLSSGVPARATLSVLLKEFIDVETLVRDPKTESADHIKTYTVKLHDTLSGIATAEYGDPAQWRPIAGANRIDNPRALVPGQVLTIPPLT